MKKVLSVLILTLCFTTPAFSQLRMNGWGRAVWVPLFFDQDEEPKTAVQSTWGDTPGLEFMFTASSTNIGVDLGIMASPGTIAQAGNAKIWWRPNPYFKGHIGLGRVDVLRGQVASSTGAYAYARGRLTGATAPNGKNQPILQIDDGDGIFSRFNLSKWGAILEITPIQGLFIGAAVAPQFIQDNGNPAETVYKGVHVAAGYQIEKIGHARLGYIGGNEDNGSTGNAGENWDFSWDRRIEAAFALTAVQDLLVDIGLKYSLHKHPGILDQPGFSLENPLYAALGLMYTGIDKLSLGFALDGHFLGTATATTSYDVNPVTSAPQIAFNFYPTYSLDIFDIGADITFGAQFGDIKGENDLKMFGFGAHVQKRYGHGNVRAGIYANAPVNGGDQKWGMSIPVWITYSF